MFSIYVCFLCDCPHLHTFPYHIIVMQINHRFYAIVFSFHLCNHLCQRLCMQFLSNLSWLGGAVSDKRALFVLLNLFRIQLSLKLFVGGLQIDNLIVVSCFQLEQVSHLPCQLGVFIWRLLKGIGCTLWGGRGCMPWCWVAGLCSAWQNGCRSYLLLVQMALGFWRYHHFWSSSSVIDAIMYLYLK